MGAKKPASYAQETYQGLFGDFDKDSVSNVDDVQPLVPHFPESKIEEVSLANEMDKLFRMYENELIPLKGTLVALLRKMIPDTTVGGRVKTPYSIINKLFRTKLRASADKRANNYIGFEPVYDLIGTRVMAYNQAQLWQYVQKITEEFAEPKTEWENIRILNKKNYYEKPNNGYRGYHFMVEIGTWLAEIQVKTKRQQDIDDITHELYKTGVSNVDVRDYVSKVAYRADIGDADAIAEYDKIMSDIPALEKQLLTL